MRRLFLLFCVVVLTLSSCVDNVIGDTPGETEAPDFSSEGSGDELPTENVEEEEAETPKYRIVEQGRIAFIYEDFPSRSKNNQRSVIHVASISDPKNKVPSAVQLHFISHLRVNLYLDCDKLSPDFSVVCYFGESVPETNLTYNDSASTISVTLMDYNDSEEHHNVPDAVDVTLRMGPKHLVSGSQVIFNRPKSKLISGLISSNDKCQIKDLLTVKYNYTMDLCHERSTPCQQLCKSETGGCYCKPGYVKDAQRPHLCLGTHVVEIVADGLLDVLDMLNLEPNQHAMLLKAHFDDVTSGAMHHVDIKHDSITATTVDTPGTTAEDSAKRLRRDLLDADNELVADLGLHKITSVTLSSGEKEKT